jgi:Flp pilus assembly protein TadG
MRNKDTSRGRRRSSSGSVLVETSLIFVVFAVLLIGAFDFAQFLFIHQALVERARSAGRWSSLQEPINTVAVRNMVLYNQAATPGEGTPGYFNLTSTNVSVTAPDAGTDNYRLNISISGYTYTVLSPYIAGTYTGPPILISTPLGLYN